MKKLLGVLAVAAVVGGLSIFATVGQTLWVAGDIERTHTSMIFLCLLFLLFPIVGLISTSRRRR